jgi:hypothetical protein
MSDTTQQESVSLPGQPDPITRLKTLLGAGTVEPPTAAGGAFAEALAEVKEARLNEGKRQAKVLIEQALHLVKQRDRMAKDFAEELEKFDTGLGEVVGKIEKLAAGIDVT